MSTHHHFTLETARLIVRPLRSEDLEAVTRVLNESFGEEPDAIRREWLEWQIASYTALARLWQPPYGDRAVTLQSDSTVIGLVGFVQSWGPFEKLPSLARRLNGPPSTLARPEFGLYWATAEAHRGKGYATESASAMIDYAFNQLHVQRVVATTDDDNLASQRVMRKLGMSIEHNPDKEPEWFQVVGVLDHP
ncbi:MAG: GNAT family N-acetyltransferase [Chloroflexi bacterium]|nr:GNAT family N-acetyltransferase [Chloroflexota bacterium]